MVYVKPNRSIRIKTWPYVSDDPKKKRWRRIESPSYYSAAVTSFLTQLTLAGGDDRTERYPEGKGFYDYRYYFFFFHGFPGKIKTESNTLRKRCDTSHFPERQYFFERCRHKSVLCVRVCVAVRWQRVKYDLGRDGGGGAPLPTEISTGRIIRLTDRPRRVEIVPLPYFSVFSHPPPLPLTGLTIEPIVCVERDT